MKPLRPKYVRWFFHGYYSIGRVWWHSKSFVTNKNRFTSSVLVSDLRILSKYAGESLYVSCVYSYRKALSFFLVKKKITMASSIFSSLNTLFAIVSNVEQHLSLERFSPFDTISALHIIFCEYSDSSRVFCSRRIYTMGPIKIP